MYMYVPAISIISFKLHLLQVSRGLIERSQYCLLG